MSDTIILSDGVRELNLTDGVTYHGPVAGTLDRSTAGHLKWTVLITAGDGNARAVAAGDIRRLLNRAAAAASLGRTATVSLNRGTNRAAVYDLTGGTIGYAKLEADGATEQYTLDLLISETSRSPLVPVLTPALLTGSDTTIVVRGIEGDDDAGVHLELADQSPSPIVRVHWARTPPGLSLADASDYSPWVDLAAVDSGDDVSDASALGGGYVERNLTGLAWTTLARAEQPAGLFQRGRMDGFIRAAGSGTALAAPTSLALAVQNAVVSQRTMQSAATTPAASGIHGEVNLSGNATTTLSRTGATAGGTQLFVAVLNATASGIAAPNAALSAPGTTFTRILDERDSGSGVRVIAWLVSNAGNSTVTVTTSGYSSAVVTTVAFVELLNLGSSPLRLDSAAVLSAPAQPPPQLSVTSDEHVDAVAIVLGALNTPITGTVVDITGGMTMLGNGAWRQMSGANQTASAKVMIDTGNWSGVAVMLSVPTTETASGTVTYDEPTPGELPVAEYRVRVQTRDRAGYLSNATASAITSTTVKRSAVSSTWNPVTYGDSYVLTIQVAQTGLPTRWYETEVQDTAYLLTTLDGLAEARGLPALTGAMAPPPLLEVRIGVAGDATIRPVTTPLTRGDGVFWLTQAFADRMLPPMSPALADWQDYVIEVAAVSANGAAATVKLDALWIVPARTYAMLELWGAMTPTLARWVIETHRSGRDVLGWLEDLVTGEHMGQLRSSFGVPALPAGSAAAFLTFETATGHRFDAAVVPSLSVMPRQQLEAAA